MHYFSNLFWYWTLHVSYRFIVHHQESSTVYTAIGIFHRGYVDCLLAGSEWNWCSCVATQVSHTLDSWWWTVNLYDTCRVLYQNIFEKKCISLVFVIRKYRTIRFTAQGNMKVVLCGVTRYKYSVEHSYRRFGVDCFVGLQCRTLYLVTTGPRIPKDSIGDTQFRRNPTPQGNVRPDLLFVVYWRIH